MEVRLPTISLLLLIAPDNAEREAFLGANFAPEACLEAGDLRELLSVREDALLAAMRQDQVTVCAVAGGPKAAREYLRSLAKRAYLRVCVLCVGVNDALPRSLFASGFRAVTQVASLAEVELIREPMPAVRHGERGPFDVIGDIHGCLRELVTLLLELGYRRDGALTQGALEGEPIWRHPEGRRIIFVGDLVDRGPASLGCLRLAYAMCESGHALFVPGNHEQKLLRKLAGEPVPLKHGLELTWAEFTNLEGGPNGPVGVTLEGWLKGHETHLIVDAGRLLIAHAGLPERMHGRNAGRVSSFALFGDTTGNHDEYGLPIRRNWAREYAGAPAVVYGHTPVPEAIWYHNTICLDTGCVFGGKLTALRWPERELVAVKANQQYTPLRRPLAEGVLARALANLG